MPNQQIVDKISFLYFLQTYLGTNWNARHAPGEFCFKIKNNRIIFGTTVTAYNRDNFITLLGVIRECKNSKQKKEIDFEKYS